MVVSVVFLLGGEEQSKPPIDPLPECSVIGECPGEGVDAVNEGSANAAYTRPEEEVKLKSAVEEGAADLGLASGFLYSLADNSFRARHPELVGRRLDRQNVEQATEDEPLRMEWLKIAEAWLILLQTNFSEESIAKLGQFQSGEDTTQVEKIQQLGIPVIALYGLADARLHSIFARSGLDVVNDVDSFLKTDNGKQIWKGVALDTLKDISSDDSTVIRNITQNKPDTQGTRDIRDTQKEAPSNERTLAAGEGHILLMDIPDGVTQLSVNIDAPPEAVQLSVFQPAFLSQDSDSMPNENEAIAYGTTQTQIEASIDQAGVYSTEPI